MGQKTIHQLKTVRKKIGTNLCHLAMLNFLQIDLQRGKQLPNLIVQVACESASLLFLHLHQPTGQLLQSVVGTDQFGGSFLHLHFQCFTRLLQKCLRSFPFTDITNDFRHAYEPTGSISERRTYLMLDPARSGLPPFLAPAPGIESGFMVAQYTAAALVSENKVLAHPASVDSIPTSAGMEDHVSMGPIAARGAAEIIANVTRVVAIELLCGAQGVEQHVPLRPGRGVVEAVRRLREVVPPLTHDRPLAPDIAQVAKMIGAGEFRLADQTVA